MKKVTPAPPPGSMAWPIRYIPPMNSARAMTKAKIFTGGPPGGTVELPPVYVTMLTPRSMRQASRSCARLPSRFSRDDRERLCHRFQRLALGIHSEEESVKYLTSLPGAHDGQHLFRRVTESGDVGAVTSHGFWRRAELPSRPYSRAAVARRRSRDGAQKRSSPAKTSSRTRGSNSLDRAISSTSSSSAIAAIIARMLSSPSQAPTRAARPVSRPIARLNPPP